MGLLDDIMGSSPETITQPKPERSRFVRDGYFDWDNSSYCQEKDVTIGVIFPPHKDWLDERIAAVKAKRNFPNPFMLIHGIHAVGLGDRDKVYTECRKTLVNDNKAGEPYSLIPKDVFDAGNTCPICEICWDELWPKVKEFDEKKDSPEYKAYKAAHKTACPQQKYLVNFLPAGCQKTVVFDLPKTVAEALTTIHWDRQQPDLLWPYSTAAAQSAWVQIRRMPQPQGTPTKYSANTIFVGTPFVFDQNKQFNEAMYRQILAGVTDLRDEARRLQPSPEATAKAVDKLVKLAPFRIRTDERVQQEVAKATAGHVGHVASPRPQVATSSPVSVVTPAALAPAALAPAAIATPAALAPTTSKAEAFDVLDNLLNGPPA